MKGFTVVAVEQHLEGFHRVLGRIRVLPLDRATMRRFAQIRGDLRAEGLLIGDFDTLIAATALENDLTLITHNTRHFERVPELRLYRANS